MFRMVWSLAMTIVYLGISYLVLFTPVMLRYNQHNDPSDDRNMIPRLVLGLSLFFYAVFRGYRVWKEKR